MQMYDLAHLLPPSVWAEYGEEGLPALTGRILANVAGRKSDLPAPFVGAWVSFMREYGWDGADQLFVSSPRYADSPHLLVSKLGHNRRGGISNPADILKERVASRRRVMRAQEERGGRGSGGLFARCAGANLEKRNLHLDHLMWIRNAPKLRMARVTAAFRSALLAAQADLLAAGRLEAEGDVFHVSVQQLDAAIKESSFDLRAAVTPNRATYARAKSAKSCPMLIDSRGRILKPNLVEGEPGALVGAAISPGVASGRVRVCTCSTDPIAPGEVLVAIVTDPAWTPMFAGASAVVLQIGGALQHGALCAREYGEPGLGQGKPAVSGIDVMASLKTGMQVTVDGNTGIVRIDESLRRSFSRRLSDRDLQGVEA
ncbi:hypothetical protein EMIHUDRAFT_431919, partial [Emiliania huxleyi CCMP1516]|uniref:PEP-utilising enzyme mobile domain-containing protein n=2 Tax=Emiliania huxleyi TaxID=2903 RepID=A0A0D3L213_EMIH1